MRVLVVEDEVRLAENVASALREGPTSPSIAPKTGSPGSTLLRTVATT